MFIGSVFMFVMQLEGLPVDFDLNFWKGLFALFPGPRGWITPGCLIHWKSLHFPDQLPGPQATSIAAKLRVLKFENTKFGGLRVLEECQAIEQMVSHRERANFYKRRLDKLFIRNLMAACAQFLSTRPSCR